MRKLLIYIFIGLVVIMAVPASATSPKTQGKGKIVATAEWFYIFSRDLNFRKATRPAGHDADRPINFEIIKCCNVAGKVFYGIFDAMDIFIKFGIANYDLNGDVFVGDTKTVAEKLSARNGFLYGGGFKFAYELNKGWIIGCDVQNLTLDHDLDFRGTSMATGQVITARYSNCKIQEWQAASYIARIIANFTPYFGARYSDLRLDQRNPNDPKRWNDLVFIAAYNVGVFTGVDWNFGKRFKLYVDGRFIDETAVTIGAGYILF